MKIWEAFIMQMLWIIVSPEYFFIAAVKPKNDRAEL